MTDNTTILPAPTDGLDLAPGGFNAGFDWTSWQPRVRATLLFVIDQHHGPGGEVLLIEKKRGFGAGKVNGPGGKIAPGESAIAAAVRETIEETGIEPLDPVAAGHLAFSFRDGLTIAVDVFISGRWRGALAACEEADPFWCPLDQVPYDRMWQDDRHWLPSVLAGGRVRGRFGFDGERMIECHMVLES